MLLVAHPSRRRQLTPWLTVEGEPVGYSLEHYSLEDEVSDVAAGASEWDVIVVDGESFPDERGRLALLRRLDERPRVSAVVYVCSRLPLDREIEHASRYCDDWILPGWAHPERVRRRIQVIALAPWLDTSSVRSGRYRPMFKWWFALLVVDFFVLMWGGAMPAEGIYPYISLIGAAYWFGYFLVILPLLGVIEKPLPMPATIEDDFNAHYDPKTGGTHTVVKPAE